MAKATKQVHLKPFLMAAVELILAAAPLFSKAFKTLDESKTDKPKEKKPRKQKKEAPNLEIAKS
jgi:hypothetical protein